MRDPWIIIPSYNGRARLEESLPSLRETIPEGVRVLVVDNGSDGDADWLRHEFPWVDVLALPSNLGFSRACNLGIHCARLAGAECFILLNNDTRLLSGWFEALTGAADRNPNLGIIGIRQVDELGRLSPRSEVERRRWASARGAAEPMTELVPTDWVEGSCILIRESVVATIGYLDPIYSPAYFEEVDYCRRARQQGIGVAVVWSAAIEHIGAGAHSPAGRFLAERNYYLFHASDPEGAKMFFPLVRHACKKILTGALRLRVEWAALAGALALRRELRLKRHRDGRGVPCPLEGTGLTRDRDHETYLAEIAKLEHRRTSPTPSSVPIEPTDLRASVVIPVRERTSDLEACLDHVLAQQLDRGSFEVIVCDDGSSASASTRIEAMTRRDPRVHYVRQDPRGPAAARNLGVANARAPVVVFTDSDTLAEPSWLSALLAPLDDPEVIAVEGPVRPPRPASSPLEEAPRNEGGVHLTANMAYRREVLWAIGGLDESFPLAAFEDVDLALCASRHGRIAFAPGAVVIHPWRRVTLASSLRRLRQLDWLIVTADRHGCLGWVDRPTRHPRWRVIRAALVTLPLGRIRTALSFLRSNWRDSLTRIGISLAEMVVAWRHVPRWLMIDSVPDRRRYLPREAS